MNFLIAISKEDSHKWLTTYKGFPKELLQEYYVFSIEAEDLLSAVKGAKGRRAILTNSGYEPTDETLED